MKVFLTVDVEIWCDGWNALDENFDRGFSQYIYGKTADGAYGLPYQLATLNDYDLKGVFFVEPLYATRFGLESLRDTVSLIEQAGQEVQLHLHTEWADEARPPLVDDGVGKRQYLRNFSAIDQTELVRRGLSLLQQTTTSEICAFRAGNFGMNRNTLTALRNNGIHIDSSYNESMYHVDRAMDLPSQCRVPTLLDGVWEYPMTVFRDGTGRQRHLQLTACSLAEIETVLWQAAAAQRDHVVILLHSFELLNEAHSRQDKTVCKRFEGLCRFLNHHRDTFDVVGFSGLHPERAHDTGTQVSATLLPTLTRYAEQAMRRFRA